MTTTKKHFLNAKESALIVGKSEITMKRFIKDRYTKAQSNKDQNVLNCITRKKAPKGYFWLIDESFLREEFNIEQKQTSEERTVEILIDQLHVKDEQIKSLLERQRENNVLMKGLQDKVLVLESGTPEEVFSEEKTAEYSEKTKDKETQSETPKAPQKGFWGRIFS